MVFRVARHSNNINDLKIFYTQILGLELLGEFQNHSNYNGVFLGKKGLGWHLEFTESQELADHIFDQDDALIFYPTSELEYTQIVTNIQTHNIKLSEAKNPYWKNNGLLIHDSDGYPIIISKQKINN